MALWRPPNRPRFLRAAALAASVSPAPGPAQSTPQRRPRGPRRACRASTPTFPPTTEAAPGPTAPPPGAIQPNMGISTVAPVTFEYEAPAPAATREEVTAEAVSIRSDASSAFGGKADAIEAGQFRLQIARSRSSTASKSGPLKGRNRPKSAIQDRCRERRLWDRKAVVQ